MSDRADVFIVLPPPGQVHTHTHTTTTTTATVACAPASPAEESAWPGGGRTINTSALSDDSSFRLLNENRPKNRNITYYLQAGRQTVNPRGKQAGRQAGRKTMNQKDRQAGRQAGSESERQAGRQAGRQTMNPSSLSL